MAEPERRRIDRILGEDYLDDLEERDTAEIRQMRDDCEREETGISYTRRVLQARIDILRAEIRRRSEAGQEEASSVLRELPDVLGDEERDPSPLSARAPRNLQPPVRPDGRREVDRVLEEAPFGDIRERSLEELSTMAQDLADREQALSQTRRVLLDRIDALQDELARRYKSGTADVRDVIAGGG